MPSMDNPDNGFPDDPDLPESYLADFLADQTGPMSSQLGNTRLRFKPGNLRLFTLRLKIFSLIFRSRINTRSV